jgi:hypothetical protein
MPDSQSPEKRAPWWQKWITPQTFITSVMCVVSVTVWWQGQENFRQRIEERVTVIEHERIKHIETRLDTIDAATALTYVRRDVMTEQLAKMQSDVTALRDEVREIKLEVRKIR